MDYRGYGGLLGFVGEFGFEEAFSRSGLCESCDASLAEKRTH